MPDTHAGSRMHVLDWIDGRSGDFTKSLNSLLAPSGAIVLPGMDMMPRGHGDPTEARLCRPCEPLLPRSTSLKLRAWWLAVDKPTANDPNWDLVTTAMYPGDRPGLVLVEAKAHVSELANERFGKRVTSSTNSLNHARIGEAISEARDGLSGTEAGVGISRDKCYQLSNRVAFAWKLASEGMPIVLIYLRFAGDDMIAGPEGLIRNGAHWRELMRSHANGIIPDGLWGRRITADSGELWLLEACLPVARPSASLVDRRNGIRSRTGMR